MANLSKQKLRTFTGPKMATTSYSSNLFSHPGIQLEEHLITVAELADTFISENRLENKDVLRKLCKIIAFTHDIGKATKHFQDYLTTTESQKLKMQRSKLTSHSLFSALCAFFMAKRIHRKRAVPSFCFFAIRRNYGDLQDVFDDIIFDDNDANFIQKQLESIDEAKISILPNKLHQFGLPILLDKNIISQWISDFAAESRKAKNFSKT